jgi:hypothetical protein
MHHHPDEKGFEDGASRFNLAIAEQKKGFLKDYAYPFCIVLPRAVHRASKT